MSERATTFETFTVERIYEFTPDKVFAAWAGPKTKARWFAGPKES